MRLEAEKKEAAAEARRQQQAHTAAMMAEALADEEATLTHRVSSDENLIQLLIYSFKIVLDDRQLLS